MTGDVRYNSRALKQLRVLSDEGYQVLAIGLAEEEVRYNLDEHIVVHLLKRPQGSGPGFFRRCHKLFKEGVSQTTARVYHASDLYNLPAVVDVAAAKNAKVVYDARERYPYVTAASKRPWVRWFWGFVESYNIKQADVVFTVSLSIASHISASYNVDLPEVLYNVPEFKEPVSSDLLREDLSLPTDQRIILHQGKMQKDRGCLLLAEAMQFVNGGVLVFLGDGPIAPLVRAKVDDLQLQGRVKFKDAVPPDQLHAYTCSADIGVTLLEDTCLNHRFALPNKLFEYLMAGLPVLGSDLPESGGLIEEFDVGRVVYPEDPRVIGGVLQDMIDSPASRQKWSAATRAVFETFNWEDASQIFRRNYKNLI